MKTYRLLILTLLAIITTSCGDDIPYNDRAALYDIVTFDGAGEDGAMFSFRQINDSPIIHLVAHGITLDEKIAHKGQRLLIGYYPISGNAYVSDQIELIGYSQVNQNEVVITPSDKIANWDKNPIWLNSIWRSGTFLNLNLRADQSGSSRRFELIADQSTINEPMPHLYIAHDLLGSPENYSRQIYASFDLSSVWNLNSCKGVIIHINDSNLEQDTYTFTKTDE